MRILPRALALFSVLLGAAGSAPATIGVSFQMQLGNPTGATTDPANRTSHLIQRPQYALDYNDTTRESNWVSWNFTSADRGNVSRTDAFAADPLLPAGFTAIDQNSYRNSGYDRGHMCPSADRTLTLADNQATFFMTNIVPQTPDNNQGPWARFEDECRRIADTGNEMLIVSGPGGFGGAAIASGVAIPGHTWKIVVVVPTGPGTAVSRIAASTRVIALKVPNIAGIRSTPWQNFITSAAQIERDTGYTFFTGLDPGVAAALRVKVDGQPDATDGPRIANLSTRTHAGTGDQVAIAGFAIAGPGAKTVLVRAVGPALRAFGLTNVLAAPRLELMRSGTTTPLASNTGWSTAANSTEIAAAAARSGAFALVPGSADAAILTTLATGAYTALVSAADNQPGVSLIEVFDLSGDSSAARLVNLSTRARTGPGEDTLIAGIVISGALPRRVLIRAAGPALAQFGVPGFLARPQLTLYSGSTVMAANAGWTLSGDREAIAGAATRTGAFAFGGTGADAAIVVELAAGAYTAQVSGFDGTNGIALVEVYEVP